MGNYRNIICWCENSQKCNFGLRNLQKYNFWEEETYTNIMLSAFPHFKKINPEVTVSQTWVTHLHAIDNVMYSWER